MLNEASRDRRAASSKSSELRASLRRGALLFEGRIQLPDSSLAHFVCVSPLQLKKPAREVDDECLNVFIDRYHHISLLLLRCVLESE